jgi:hypothetical protein
VIYHEMVEVLGFPITGRLGQGENKAKGSRPCGKNPKVTQAEGGIGLENEPR